MSGAKMAKSSGNIARVGDLLDAGVSPRALRYSLIAVHYRAGLEHSDASLAASAAAVARLDAAVAALEAYREERLGDPELPSVLDQARAAFTAALEDDLNVSAALAVVFDLVRDLNRRIDARTMSTSDAETAVAALHDLDTVLGVLPDPADDLEPELRALLDERAEARAARDWSASDRLRDALAERGISVEDTRDGQRWRRVAEVVRG
jgi:cysteinyl-tRNA synthetase